MVRDAEAYAEDRLRADAEVRDRTARLPGTAAARQRRVHACGHFPVVLAGHVCWQVPAAHFLTRPRRWFYMPNFSRNTLARLTASAELPASADFALT